MAPIWPEIIRPIGEVDGIIYRASVFEDGSLEYWFDYKDLDYEEGPPTIPDERKSA